MAREGTRYMVRNGYILLEDLESWYASGFVTPDDTVRIFNSNGDSKAFKISSLIFLYGSEHPFRRAAKLLDSDYSSSDSDEERAGPSTVPPPKKVGGAFEAKRNDTEKEQKSVPQKVGGAFGVRKVSTPPTSEKKPEEVLKKVGGACEKEVDHDIELGGEDIRTQRHTETEKLMIGRNNPCVALMDPPLTTDRLEMIGKDELQDFYRDIKHKLTVVGIETAYFKRANWKCGYCSSEKNTVVCNTQLDAFNHVLNNKHKENMQFTAPESDLKFWNDWIDEMNLGAPEDSIRYNDYPLFNADNEPEEDRITGQKVIDEMNRLKSLFARLKCAGKPDQWFNSVYPVKESICRMCNFAPFSPKLFYVHLFYDNHIAQLAKCQISKKSFEFWEQKFLNMKELKDEEEKTEEEKKGNTKETKKFDIRKESAKFGNFSEGLNMGDRKWENPGIPLLDPPIKLVAKLQQDQFIRYYRSLSKAMTNPASRRIAQLRKVNWKCGYCSSNRTTVSFFTELEAFDHILGQKHKEKMKFTAPLDDLLFWGNWAVEINNELAAKEEEEQKKLPEDPTSSGSSQNPITTSSAVTNSSVLSSNFRNNPRVALMDPPITTDRFQMCRQNKFVHFCNELSASLTELGIKTANSKFASWKCGYCSSEMDTVVCNTQFDAFNHVLKQKHKEKMKFTAPELDFKFWCDWVDEMNSELQKSKSSERQKVAAIPESSNEPRVPLLAPMPKNENTVPKKQFNEMLDECAKMFQTHKKRLSAAKNVPAFVACTYCSKPDAKPLAPSNVQDQLLHILKLTHRENMQYKACLSDLQYWKSWVETYGIPKNVLESRKSPSTVPAKPKPGIENNEPFKKSSNNPRVPLLDVPVHRGKLLKQSKYKEYCEYFCKVLKEKQSCAETEKSVKCICFHCPGDTRITTVMELLQHVFNSKHAENIRFLANREDFTYHEDIIRKMPRIQTPAAVSRTPAYVVRPDYTQGGQRILNSTPPMIAPMSAPIPTDPVHRTVSATPTPTQTPRTLCKLPCFGLRPVYMSKERTKPTEAQLSFINGLTSDGGTSGLPYVADGTYCGCCDEDMTGWDVVRIACHVFSDSHLRKLANLVYVCDFQHWIDMIERRGLASTPQAAKPGSVSAQTVTQSSIEQRTPHSASVVRPDPPIVRQSVVQRPIPQVVRTRCTLPLYVSCPTIDPTGPFNSQVSFINRVAIRGIEATRSYVADGTFCGFCNVDMTGYNLIRVVKHAFSINHLRKLDNLPHLSVFQHWIIMIERSDFVLTPQFTSSPLQFKSSPLYTLLGLKSMKAALNDFDVFSNFSPTQMELISNVDMAKIEQCAELLNEFGGCIYCEKWLLTGREVFEHWIPQQHFLKIRQQHPVSRRRMDIFMECVEMCQKEKLGCIIM
ncbi:hypothetical protein L5515_000070 [Caenorhabditis briggsae]|uniref:Uncharacterized protein n=1 Tax=Caenorhabditis briggsae TaxID=6238 RepID=A0AAE9J0V9_CAEBR|nr:hypothetical protein L5515_000070 [Caenorhabditis briggsae]